MGDEGSADPTPRKRARTGDLKRVAEIVMVLSAMGEMRAGKDPTAAEKALAAEAREKLAGICEVDLRPKDLISREAVRVVVEDLGLNRSRDPMMGFRPTKMSIAEKLNLTKRKMEESKTLPLHSGFSSQHSAGESHVASIHVNSKFLPDRQGPIAYSTGGFQSVSPVVHVPPITSTSLKQSHAGGQLAASPLKSSTSHLEKKAPVSGQPHAETPHVRYDGRLNGSAYLAQFQANSAEKTPSNSGVQSTSATYNVKLTQPNNLVDHAQGNSEGIHAVNSVQTSHHVLANQESKVSEVHGSLANFPAGQQPMQGVMLIPAPSFTTHEEISRSVQKILQPKVFDHPNWNPPSAEYTNKPLTCQVCKITTSDIESILVCDACEKGTHLKCLQSYCNKEGIPKAEWHCPRCLMTNNGKPFPPKYGRVTRTIAQKASSSPAATSASSEKRPENMVSKINQQKSVANGNVNLSNPVHNPSSGFSTGASRDSKEALAVDSHSSMKKEDELSMATLPTKGPALVCTASSVEAQCSGEDFNNGKLKNENESSMVVSTNSLTEGPGLVPNTAKSQSQSSDRSIEGGGLLKCGMQMSNTEAMQDQTIVTEKSCHDKPNDTISETTTQSGAPGEAKETDVPNNAEFSANQNQETGCSASTSDKDMEGGGSLKFGMQMSNTEAMQDQKIVSEKSCHGNPNDTISETTNHSGAPGECKEIGVPNNAEFSANQKLETGCSTSNQSIESSRLWEDFRVNTDSNVQLGIQDGPQSTSNREPDDVGELKQSLVLKETYENKDSCNILPVVQNKYEGGDGAIESGGSADSSTSLVLESDAVQWLGDVLQVNNEKTYYQSCQINGVSHKIQDHVLISSGSQNILPAQLLSMWEDKQTGSKWFMVNQFYTPGDLPEAVSCPSTPENNEVYGSKKGSAVVASSVRGPCVILSLEKFKGEMDRRANLNDANTSLHPIYMCRWVYDESKGVFQSFAD